MRFECPLCGQCVELDADYRVEFHDATPPHPSLCRAGGADATRVVLAQVRAKLEALLAQAERDHATQGDRRDWDGTNEAWHRVEALRSVRAALFGEDREVTR